MRLVQFLNITEDIPVAPRNYKVFTRNRIKEIDFIEKKLQEIGDKVEQMKMDGEEFEDLRQDASSAIRTVHDELHADDILGWGEKVYGSDELRAVRAFNLEGLKGNLDLTLMTTREDDPDMRILANALNRYIGYVKSIEGIDELNNIITLQDEIYAAMDERGLFDEEYPEQAKMAETLVSIIDDLREIRVALNSVMDAAEKYQVILNKRAAFFRGEQQFTPETEDVETLWHASAYATEIVQNGFSPEGRGKRRGVGTFGEFEGISFTHDKKIAMDIVRSLKELTMIANGQVTRQHILSWMQKEGIDPQKAVSGHGPEILTSDDIQSVAILYRYYLAFSPMRADPVFVNIMDVVEQLKGRKPNDSGIIEAQVNMRVEGIRHQSGESEWIVPPSAVQSFKRVL